MASPVVAGLDEEIAQMEASQQRTNGDNSAASTSSAQAGPSWSANNQNDWVKHESFVHKLESLLQDDDEREDGQGKEEVDGILHATSSGEEEGEDDEEMARVGTDDAHQKALRRRRKLLKLKQRYARRKSLPPSSSSSLPMHDEEQEQLNEADEVLTTAAALEWAASNASPTLPDADDQKGSTSRSTSPSAPPSTTTSAEAGTEEDEDFYDAQAGPSTSPSLHIHSHVRKMNLEDDDADHQQNEMSWLQMSPRPNATASSATLRQDAMEGAIGSQDGSDNQLHHQASTATLLGIAEDGDSVNAPTGESSRRSSLAKHDPYSRRRSSVLPPAAPHPTAPLPSTPSSSSNPISPVTLGPNGTIRGGRPRGATVGAVPGAHGNVRPRVRPRSLLSNELLLAGNDISISSVSPKFNLSSSTSSESSAMRTSSILPSLPTEEGLHSATLTSTPSSSAASIGSSSAIGDAGGSKTSLPAVESRSRSGSGTGLLQHIQSRPRSQANFVIAVVGHKGSGKSTVIRKGLRQFGLSKPTVVSDRITSHSTICIVDQKERTIEVLEMDASVLLNGPSKRFAWPRSLPYIDAAILCYDASQISSFRGMSELLENFAMNQLSTVMLACKSEISPKAVDPYYASDMASVYNVGLAECSVQSEEGKKRMRDCFSYLVKEVAKGRATMRMSETGSISAPATRTATSPLAAQSMSMSGSKDSGSMSMVSPDAVLQPSSDSGHTGSRSPSSSTAAPSINMRDRQSIMSRKRFDRKMSDVTIGSIEAGSEEDGGAFQQSIDRAQLGLQSAKSVGGYVSIEELWDKLFFSAVSGNDERFLHMFMTFFRGFARPIDLLNQIVVRFDALARGEKSDGVMIRYSLMKLTTMLGDWMQEYPGDLSDPETFSILVDFYDRLLVHPATTHIAAPMQPLLDVVRSAPDLDAIWSKDQDNDKPRSVAADVPPVKPYDTRTRAPSTSSNSAAAVAISRLQEVGRGASETHTTANSDITTAASSVASHGQSESLKGNRRRSTSDVTTISSEGHKSANSSAAMSNSTGAGGMSGNGSSQYLGNSGQLPPIGAPKGPVSVQMQKAILRNTSNMLFEIRDEDIAHELTRIEWDLFCTIGPRDLLRHILVSRSLRAPNSSVAQSIAHFNYISAWVCSLVLVQSKAKQRAKMLEKFMEVATILRRTNNYNTLHAILAGLGNASIHRLKNTRELLNGKKVMKQYQSLTRLMGSERSFAAYRLALENSEGRTIPYLGVHLQDILSTSDGNPSKRASDGMIHWRKFNLMYDAVMAIVRCQQYQMSLRENTTLAQMIVDLPVWDEEAQYQRSLQVEQRQSSAVSGSTGSRIIKQLLKTNT
ncbi:ras GEF [Meira miltonrushii]|uniref:Ras GEF n=1 Tax=Meira miltonrushii TaxID=1280837 RepID=A0A316V891_9BASI|nr:ras GEF [Meira miltonrushii]PWN33248.1 ras GEF [Meira miltonrushii]